MERIRRIAPVAGRVGQRLDDLVELDERSGPAVDDHHGERVRVGRALVDEVNVEAVDAGLEVVEAVERPLLRAPVVLVPPVRHQLAHVVQVAAVGPAGALQLVGEARVLEPRLQIVQHGIRHVDHERHDGVRRTGRRVGRAVAGRPAARGGNGKQQGDRQPARAHVSSPSGAG